MDDHRSRHLLRVLQFGMATVAIAVAIAAVVHESRGPSWVVVVAFAVVLLVAENTAVLLPTSVGISPGTMIVMAGIAALNGHGTVLGACAFGAAGGVVVSVVKQHRFGDVIANCSQFLVSSAAAAVAFNVVGRHGVALLLAGVLGAAVFTVVNLGQVIPYVGVLRHERLRDVWADFQPAVPNFVAFGLVGAVVGQLAVSLGVFVLPLLLIPAGIARAAYTSYLGLRQAHEAAIRVFVRAIEAKDEYTAGHCERVAKYAAYVGEELRLSAARMERLHSAALMHDIGKLTVPSRLLNKPGKLTPEEFAEIRRHNEVCIHILTRVDYLQSAVPTASDQYSRYSPEHDGTDPAVLEARIVAVADAFDAMTSTRSYRQALSQEVAFAELRDKSGVQFDPQCAAALIRAIERRGERFGLGHEEQVTKFDVTPPVAGVGSAGLGDLLTGSEAEV
jgi:HD domain